MINGGCHSQASVIDGFYLLVILQVVTLTAYRLTVSFKQTGYNLANLMKLKYFFRNNHTVVIVIAALAMVLSSCATSVPVQEMSNARQTLRAAHQVKAKQFAPELFDKAENLLKAAESELSDGKYAQARAYAVAARQEAIRARQKALDEQRN
ncbi:MAG: DUF4398 domain-containing protein [Gammaproteobacteria bacterium]|jgi:hypothetical protein